MKLGASSACYYPLETERALRHVLQLGFSYTEIFFNAACELNPDFVQALALQVREHGVNVTSLHPFTSFAESTCLFSQYRRRFADTLEFYKRYFEAAQLLDAPILVIHGCRKPGVLSHQEYFERFGLLMEEGKKMGVTVAQENVNAHFSQDPAFLQEMRAALGEDFQLVFDVKQAVRAGYDPLDFAWELRESICHLHLSDHDAVLDCVPPGRGNFDFAALRHMMDGVHYDGAYMIEFYHGSYHVDAELQFSKAYLQSIYL